MHKRTKILVVVDWNEIEEITNILKKYHEKEIDLIENMSISDSLGIYGIDII